MVASPFHASMRISDLSRCCVAARPCANLSGPLRCGGRRGLSRRVGVGCQPRRVWWAGGQFGCERSECGLPDWSQRVGGAQRRTRGSHQAWVDRSGVPVGHTWSTCARKLVTTHPTGDSPDPVAQRSAATGSGQHCAAAGRSSAVPHRSAGDVAAGAAFPAVSDAGTGAALIA